MKTIEEFQKDRLTLASEIHKLTDDFAHKYHEVINDIDVNVVRQNFTQGGCRIVSVEINIEL